VDQCGGGHTPDGRESGQQRIPQPRQLADVQLAFQLETDQQEEHRHQCIVDPVFEAQRPQLQLPEGEISCRRGRIRHRQRHDGAEEQQDAPGLFGLHEALEGIRRRKRGHSEFPGKGGRPLE
jgi:hypothetical protein